MRTKNDKKNKEGKVDEFCTTFLKSMEFHPILVEANFGPLSSKGANGPKIELDSCVKIYTAISGNTQSKEILNF